MPPLRPDVDCSAPVVVRLAVKNRGLASLPAGVEVGVFRTSSDDEAQVASVKTTHALFAGQTEKFKVEIATEPGSSDAPYKARILVDPQGATFHECREDNNETPSVLANCVK